MPSDKNQLVMAVRKDWPVLRDILQKALAEIGADGVVETLTRWSGSRTTAMTFLADSLELTAAESEHLAARREIAACISDNMMPVEGGSTHQIKLQAGAITTIHMINSRQAVIGTETGMVFLFDMENAFGHRQT